MREIKFRVFDAKQFKFLEIGDFIDETWQFNGVAGLKKIGVLAYQIRENGALNSKLICDDERFKIEQFTGLYDKNKTEIYEGDIVKFNEYDFGKWKETTKKVVFNTEQAEFTLQEYPLDFYMAEKCEIIGNIYENPNPLKDTNKTIW